MAQLLLIEDNQNHTELMRAVFESSFPKDSLATFNAGSAAVAYLQQACPLPVAVVLDLSLPDMPGLDVLKMIRAGNRTRDLPVIIFTASDDTENVFQSYARGANDYVVKPMSIHEWIPKLKLASLFERIAPVVKRDNCRLTV